MAGESFNIEHLAIPAVSALIIFLSYSSQLLFLFLEPGPLSRAESWKFNILVASIWISYYRACTVDPGRVPKGWEPRKNADKDESSKEKEEDVLTRQRWCRKCSTLKPPRAHHCKKCQRCVPKMDHHCPWTCNCVSHFTFPHFVRFLFYAVVSIIYLESFLFTRIVIIWDQRSLPSYLGPSIPALAHLFVLVVANSLTLFALGILLVRTLWSLGANTTTIESWEIERHSTLVRRARYFGGQLDGPDGIKVTIKKQEFPYDIGIFQNIRDGMGGSSNILSWFWPFAATPDKNSGLHFEVNEFEDPNFSWPPPDPDRIPRRLHPINTDTDPFTTPQFGSTSDEIEAFRKRQEEDMARRGGLDDVATIRRRRKFHERHETRRRAGQNEIEDEEEEEEEEHLEDDDGDDGHSDAHDHIEIDEGEEAWRDSDGQRLGDYGVDEEVEFYDEDDVPLSVVRERIRRGFE